MSASSVASLSTSSTTSSHHQHHYHSPPSRKVIVVGSGLAGLTAATELVSRDIPVHILERQAKPGGNSIKASSGINGVPTRYQVPGSDSIEAFYADTLKSASDRLLHEVGDDATRERREKVISTLTYGSRAAINWLVDEQGVDLSRVALMGGHSHARTHRGAGQTPPGASIVLTLLKKIQQNPLATLETGTTVMEVLKREERVVGVKVSKEVDGKSEEEVIWGPVVFASGGFAGDSRGYLKKYRPDLAGFPSTNEALPGSQGLLVDVGAQLLDMEEVQVHPTGFVDPKDRLKVTKFLAAEVLRGEGGILLSQGKRFINELQTRKVVTDAVVQTTEPSESGPLKQWDVSLVLDEGTYQATKSHVDFYIWKGLIRKTTIGELDDADAALATIKEYAAIARGAVPDRLSRPSFGNWTLDDPSHASTVYVGSVTPVVHYTMGGVAFTTDAEVVDAHGRPIIGLWAAGEITGGLHGANRLGGSSLLECVVFGRLAAESAARYVEDRERDTPVEDGDCCWESR